MKKDDPNIATMIEFVASLISMRVTPEVLRNRENPVFISVPFSRKVFSKMISILPEPQVREALSDLIYITFYNAILDCVKDNEEEIRNVTTSTIISGLVSGTTTMN